MAKENSVISVIEVSCEGALDKKGIAPLALGGKSARINVVIFRDGRRDVACPFLNSKLQCRAGNPADRDGGFICFQAFPEKYEPKKR